MTDLTELITAIDFSDLSEQEKEGLVSKLNIYGYKEDKVKETAKELWVAHFRSHLEVILKSDLPVESLLLDTEEMTACFDIAFQEYQDRKKDLGIDDIGSRVLDDLVRKQRPLFARRATRTAPFAKL